jgi:curved DNA-binding protein CbpA
MQDYYNLLGIPPHASAEHLRRAFRERAKAVHPDAHPHLPSAQREALQRRFIALAQAYETLRDPPRRAAYDRAHGVAQSAARARAGSGAQGDPPPRKGPAAHARKGPAAQARASQGRAGTDGPADTETSLDDLLRDVEALLGRFGLDLRPPFEALLEELLDWARTVYRQVVEAWEGGPGRPGSAGAERAAGTRDRAADRTARPTRSDTGEARRPRGAPAAARVEAELAALRERVRRGAQRQGPAHEAPDIEAELRALKERLGRGS